MLIGLTDNNQGDISPQLWLIHGPRQSLETDSKRGESEVITCTSNPITSSEAEKPFFRELCGDGTKRERYVLQAAYTYRSGEKNGPVYIFLCVSLVFLESRLNSTQDYNLVGRLGGREENRLATIAAAREGRIWNPHRKKKKKKGWKKRLNTSTVHSEESSTEQRDRNSITHNTGIIFVVPELYHLLTIAGYTTETILTVFWM